MLGDNWTVLMSARQMDRESFFTKAFARNLGLISFAEQQQLREAKIAIAGLGGVGGQHLLALVRSGIGRFHLADLDSFDVVNINRQVGAKKSTFGQSKLAVMVEEALDINPYLEIKKFGAGICHDNLDEFLEGVDLVVDGLDFFEIDIRRALFNRARERGIHVITAGPIGFGVGLLVFAPDRGMSFDEYFNIHDDTTTHQKYMSLALGVAPRLSFVRYIDSDSVSFDSHAGPSAGLSCLLCAGVVASEALKILLRRGPVAAAPHYRQFDAYLHRYYRGYLPWGNRNPLQRLKLYFCLSKIRSKECEQVFPLLAGMERFVRTCLDSLETAALRVIFGAPALAWVRKMAACEEAVCTGQQVEHLLHIDEPEPPLGHDSSGVPKTILMNTISNCMGQLENCVAS
jgi:molybdopterin/thiamine biosynthesis adenylyltransferase